MEKMNVVKRVVCPACSSPRALQHMKGVYCSACKAGVKPTPYLALIILSTALFGVLITMLLNLGAELNCSAFGLLCGAGIVVLIAIGFGASIALTAAFGIGCWVSDKGTKTDLNC